MTSDRAPSEHQRGIASRSTCVSRQSLSTASTTSHRLRRTASMIGDGESSVSGCATNAVSAAVSSAVLPHACHATERGTGPDEIEHAGILQPRDREVDDRVGGDVENARELCFGRSELRLNAALFSRSRATQPCCAMRSAALLRRSAARPMVRGAGSHFREQSQLQRQLHVIRPMGEAELLLDALLVGVDRFGADEQPFPDLWG
jgi:hypothetical protein